MYGKILQDLEAVVLRPFYTFLPKGLFFYDNKANVLESIGNKQLISQD